MPLKNLKIDQNWPGQRSKRPIDNLSRISLVHVQDAVTVDTIRRIDPSPPPIPFQNLLFCSFAVLRSNRGFGFGFRRKFFLSFQSRSIRRQQRHSAEAAAARAVDVSECVRLLLRVTVAGVGLSVSHSPDWGEAYDGAGPTPSFLSTNLTRACDPFH